MNSEVIVMYRSCDVEHSVVVYEDGLLMLRTISYSTSMLSGYKQTHDKPTTIEQLSVLSPVVAIEAGRVLSRLMARAMSYAPGGEEREGVP